VHEFLVADTEVPCTSSSLQTQRFRVRVPRCRHRGSVHEFLVADTEVPCTIPGTISSGYGTGPTQAREDK
jgi:hypothetical protein